jgi:MFS family permease
MFGATALAMLGNYYVYDSIGPVADLLTSQLGFSDTQLGTLNGIYSVPNIFLAFLGGVLVDRLGARAVTLATAVICVLGAMLTAIGAEFPVMAAGRLLFGLGADTMIVALTVALAQWFKGGRHFALFLALNLSLARLGSFLADRSPEFARPLYQQSWQGPLWLAAGFAALTLVASAAYWLVDRREAGRGTLAIATPDRVEWRNLLRFPAELWLIIGLCVTFYAVILPFRSTFAIKYFQHVHALSLEEAGAMNSHVFLAAAFATPAFGLIVDRVGRHATLMVGGSLLLPLSFVFLGAMPMGLLVPTALLGVSFSLVPAVLWPAVALHVRDERLGTAYGLMGMLQNIGLAVANPLAGALNDAGGASAANPAGYDAMLWFFGLLSLAAFAFAVMLRLRERAPTA